MDNKIACGQSNTAQKCIILWKEVQVKVWLTETAGWNKAQYDESWEITYPWKYRAEVSVTFWWTIKMPVVKIKVLFLERVKGYE